MPPRCSLLHAEPIDLRTRADEDELIKISGKQRTKQLGAGAVPLFKRFPIKVNPFRIGASGYYRVIIVAIGEGRSDRKKATVCDFHCDGKPRQILRVSRDLYVLA